jgi:hypothetical protein
MSEANPISPKRSGCLFFILAILSLYQILFAFRVLNNNGLYGDSLSLPSVLQAGLAFLWVTLFLSALLRLARGKRYTLGYSGCLILGFMIYGLLQTILFAQADYERKRIPFLVIATIVILIAPVWLLLRREKQSAGH